MKNLFYPALLIILLFATCKKDNTGQEDEESDKFNIAEYIMVGETFWGNNANNTPPYIMTFSGDGKAFWHTLDGDGETSYDVQDNKIVLADVGYIDIENGQVSNMLLVGVNFKQGKLIKRAEQPAFIGKIYPKGQFMIWKSTGENELSTSFKDVQITITEDKVTSNFMRYVPGIDFYYADNWEYDYTNIFNDGGFKQKNIVFYVNPDDSKLTYWQNNGDYYLYYKY